MLSDFINGMKLGCYVYKLPNLRRGYAKILLLHLVKGSEQCGYMHGRNSNQRVYEPDRCVYYQSYNRYAHTHLHGLVILSHLCRCWGVSHIFASINMMTR